MGIVSIGNGLYARTREGGPRRDWSMTLQESRDRRAVNAWLRKNKRDASGKFTKQTNDDKGRKR